MKGGRDPILSLGEPNKANSSSNRQSAALSPGGSISLSIRFSVEIAITSGIPVSPVALLSDTLGTSCKFGPMTDFQWVN